MLLLVTVLTTVVSRAATSSREVPTDVPAERNLPGALAATGAQRMGSGARREGQPRSRCYSRRPIQSSGHDLAQVPSQEPLLDVHPLSGWERRAH